MLQCRPHYASGLYSTHNGRKHMDLSWTLSIPGFIQLDGVASGGLPNLKTVPRILPTTFPLCFGSVAPQALSITGLIHLGGATPRGLLSLEILLLVTYPIGRFYRVHEINQNSRSLLYQMLRAKSSVHNNIDIKSYYLHVNLHNKTFS